MTRPKSDHVALLDGLRGLAIFLVVLFHIWQQSWWNPLERWPWPDLSFLARRGYLGVELFFFISGFCLYYPFARSGGLTWREYAWRRCVKILPSYWFSLLLVLVIAPLEIPPDRLWFHLLTHLTFTHSLFFETYSSLNGVLWSLSVEVQFYLIFPLFCLLFRRNWLIGLLTMVAIALFYRLGVHRGFHETEAAVLYTQRMNQLPSFLDLFGCGMLGALGVVHWRKLPPWVANLLTVAALVACYLLVRSANTYAQGRNGDINWQAAVRTPLAVVLLALTIAGSQASRWLVWVLANPLAVGLAAISYNLYLWHAFLGWRLRALRFPAFPTAEPWTDSPAWGYAFTFWAWGLALVVATVVTFGLERPLLRLNRARGRVAAAAASPPAADSSGPGDRVAPPP